MKKSAINRRCFLKKAAAASGFPLVVSPSVLGVGKTTAPSERITMASIGLGGQGTRDMNAFLRMDDVQIVALCDVDEGSTNYEQGWLRGLAPAKAEVEKQYADAMGKGDYKGCDGYNDFRELLARDDIDAVTIGTPDHWHALIAIQAAKAGKDMYCQKPLARTIEEGRAMVTAVEKNKRVFQCGSQRRSDYECRRACEAVRNGAVGKLHTVEVGLPGGHTNPGFSMSDDPMPVPEGFDYNTWLGPAPVAPYTHKRCHWTFRWNLDYSGGQVTDWGAHFIDMAHWGMDTERTGPISVEGKGHFPPRENLWNTAESFKFTCEYKGGVTMNISNDTHGVKFIGDEGYVQLDGIVHRDDGEKVTAKDLPIKLYKSKNQYRNLIDCIRSRKTTAAPVDVAHHSIAPAHLGNIAMLTGRKIVWNPKKEHIKDDKEANAMLSRNYRAPWKL
jgi:predicted dehydrogenase